MYPWLHSLISVKFTTYPMLKPESMNSIYPAPICCYCIVHKGLKQSIFILTYPYVTISIVLHLFLLYYECVPLEFMYWNLVSLCCWKDMDLIWLWCWKERPRGGDWDWMRLSDGAPRTVPGRFMRKRKTRHRHMRPCSVLPCDPPARH